MLREIMNHPKILVIGLGSMGKRRIRNLLDLGYNDIIGFDIRNDRIKEVSKNYKIPTFSNLQDALEKKPTAMIISTPPDLHLKYAKIAIKKNIHFFMELNLFSKDVKEIIHKLNGKSIIAIPSCSMKFHPLVKELKKLLKKNIVGKILSIQHHSGSYLPLWHPWEDYRDFFVSNKETGGARELIPIDLVWLTSLFHEIKSVYGHARKISSLDVKIDDIYQIFLEFKNGIVCNFVTDVISIPPSKMTKLIGEKGTLICDFKNGTIKILKANKSRTLNLKMGKVAKGYKGNTLPETLYKEETKHFIDSLKGKKYPFSLDEELKILRVLDAIETSNKKGKKINLYSK